MLRASDLSEIKGGKKQMPLADQKRVRRGSDYYVYMMITFQTEVDCLQYLST